MGLYFKNKEISFVNYGTKTIATIYKGTVLIWEGIKSCFGKGFWINKASWKNEDGWKNN